MRFLIAGIGGLYTVGLLIVNIDLGSYGVFNLDLARPEYVMAGALWVFTVLPFSLLAIVNNVLPGIEILRVLRGPALCPKALRAYKATYIPSPQ